MTLPVKEVLSLASDAATQQAFPFWEKSSEGLITGYLAPLIGINGALVAAIILLQTVPSLCVGVGWAVAAAGCMLLAKLTESNKLISGEYSQHTGAAVSALMFPLIISSQEIMSIIVLGFVSLIFLGNIAARKISEFAALLPSIYFPLVCSTFLSNNNYSLCALLLVGASLFYFVKKLRRCAFILLVSPLVFWNFSDDSSWIWYVVMVLGGLISFVYQYIEYDDSRSSLLTFAGEGVFLLFIIGLCRSLINDTLLIVLITAVISIISSAICSIARRRIVAEKVVWSAILLVVALVIDHHSGMTTAGRAAGILGIAALLQRVSICAHNRFSSTIALFITFIVSITPISGLFKTLNIHPSEILFIGIVSSGALTLFMQKYIWQAENPWWTGIVPLEYMVKLRKWLLTVLNYAQTLPLLGFAFTLAIRFLGWARKLIHQDSLVGIQELVSIWLPIYFSIFMTAYLEAVISDYKIPFTTKSLIISMVWVLAGSVSFIWGKYLQRAYLRFTGLFLIIIPVVFSIVTKGEVIWYYTLFVSCVTLALVCSSIIKKNITA